MKSFALALLASIILGGGIGLAFATFTNKTFADKKLESTDISKFAEVHPEGKLLVAHGGDTVAWITLEDEARREHKVVITEEQARAISDELAEAINLSASTSNLAAWKLRVQRSQADLDHALTP